MHGRYPKILGLSLLMLMGIMAINASAAHAKWLLLSNKTSVLLLTFNVSAGAMEFLVPNLGIKIFCSGATGTDHTQLNGSHDNQTGSVSGKFTGCKDLELGEVCTVHGVGDPDGSISFKAEGKATMEGEKVLITGESSQFANLVYLGEECPLIGVDGKVSGSVTSELENPLTDAESHGVKIVKQKLLCGSNTLEMHNAAKGAASGTLKSLVAGNTTSMHLVGL